MAGREEVLELVNAALRNRLKDFTSPANAWRGWLTDFAGLVRTHLASSASAVMLDLRRPGTSGRIGIGEQGLQLLIDDGLSPTEAAYAVWLVFRMAITAGAEQETSLSGYVGDTGQILGLTPAADLPATQAVHEALASAGLYDTFDFDLAVVLSGVAGQIAAKTVPPASRSDLP